MDRVANLLRESSGELARIKPGTIRRNLWSCFAQHAAAELERLKTQGALTPKQLADAAWGLARHYVSLGDGEKALSNLELARRNVPKGMSKEQSLLLEVEALLQSGRADEASDAIRRGIEKQGEGPDLCLAAANALRTGTDDGKRLERDRLRLDWINKCLVSSRFAALELKDTGSLVLSNLSALAAPVSQHREDVKLSVLMPAHNAASTILTALNSVLDQTWPNLEVLVVDDGSTDDTWSLVQSIAARDNRVRVLRHGQNRGAYAARNTALGHATGTFITVHDADDWSHPQKFAVQLGDLIENGTVFNMTSFARVDSDMKVLTRSWKKAEMLLKSFPSIMARRGDLIRLGGWDEVRMGADSEVYHRLMAMHGEPAKWLFANVPLAFHLASDNCLTAQQFTGLGSLAYGARREYMQSFLFWHSREIAEGRRELRMTHDTRPFPVPAICRCDGEPLRYDLLVVADFSLQDEATDASIDMLRGARRRGLRTACFHWPLFDHAFSSLNLKLRTLVHEGTIDCIVPGESVESDLVIVAQATVLNLIPDILPHIKAKACAIVAAPLAPEGDIGQTFERAVANARQVFGVEPRVVPAHRWDEVPAVLASESQGRGPWPIDAVP